MKPRHFRNALVASSVISISTSATQAAEVNAIATGAWAEGATWSDATPPAVGNNYTIDGFTVTSPTGNNTITFPGDLITLSKTGETPGVLDLARLHNSTEQSITTTLPPIFVNDGATLQFRASNGSNRWNLGAAAAITVDGTVLFNNTGGNYMQNINLAGPVSGSGLVEYKTANSSVSTSAERTLSLNAADSTYSGDWFIQHVDTGNDYGTLAAGAANALGTGTVTLDTRARFRNNAANGFDSLTGITSSQPTASIFFNGRDWTNPSAVLTITDGSANVGTAHLNIASISQAGGSINLTVGGTKDGKLITSGDADFTGGTINVGFSGSPAGKTFDLVTYGGNLVNPPVVAVDTGRLTAVVDNGTGTNGKVTLSASGSVADLVWTGSANDDWDNNLTANFDNGGSADVFRNFDNVLFDDTAEFNNVLLVGTLTPGTITFANSARDYTLGGGGSLTGGSGLVKSGTGSLIITANNTNSGPTVVSGGTLQIGDGGTSGSIGSGSITNDAALILNRSNNVTLANSMAGTGTFTKNGAGTLTLPGNNTWSGGTTLNLSQITVLEDGGLGTGTVNVEHSDSSETTTRVNLAGVTVENDFIFNSNARTGFRGVINATGDSTSTVNGDITVLSNVGNGGHLATDTGATLILNGTLDVGGSQGSITHRFGTIVYAGGGSTGFTFALAENTARLGANNGISPLAGMAFATSGNAAFDLGPYDQTFTALTHTPQNAARTFTVTGDGTLTINTTVDSEFGPGGETTIDGTRNFNANLSGLGGFVWNGPANIFRVGLRSGASNSAIPGTFTTTLGTSSTITTLGLRVGDVAANNNGGNSFLRLGTANTIHADTINIGASGRSNATLNFADGLTDPTVTIRATDGTSRVATWEVGRVANFNTNVWTATVDTSAGEIDALVNTLRVGIINTNGQTNRQGIQNSTFTMGKGTLDVTNLVIGLQAGDGTAGNTYTANGTFTLNHADGLVAATSIRLGENTGAVTGGIRSVNGTLNLDAGTIEAVEIRLGDQTATDPAAVTTAFNFAGGTVRNLAGGDLSIAGIPLTLTGSARFEATSGQAIMVAADAAISGSGGLTKSGPGTMTIDSPYSYLGETIVEAGTLSLATASLDDEAAVRVAAGATLNLSHGQQDAIGSLSIDGVAQEPGIYDANNTSVITGTGSLLVGSAGSPFEIWAAGAGLDGTPGKEAGFDDDPDGDGVANGLEWVLGGNPLDGQSGALVATTAAGGLTLGFTRNEDSVGEATLVVEYNTDLGAVWQSAPIGATSSGPDANGVTVTIDTDATPDEVTVNIPASNAPGGKLFGRLKATQP